MYLLNLSLYWDVGMSNDKHREARKYLDFRLKLRVSISMSSIYFMCPCYNQPLNNPSR